ncbi:MAG: VOC family protein [Phaeodactylibacter sp.]|nr:VOC family protein [Phaeodactylibacter sp.]
MTSYLIGGIQQIGIGVANAEEAWALYRRQFGVDVPVFREKAQAALMLPYTGGQPRSRYAILALNLQGGGGFEIWQYTCRKPQASDFEVRIGDLGIFASKIKCPDIKHAYRYYQENGIECLSDISNLNNGPANFFTRDPFGNVFQVVEAKDWFQFRKQPTGGVYGAIIGVSDIDKAMKFYSNILGYDLVAYDERGQFEELKNIPGGQATMRRVLLQRSTELEGPFARLFGQNELELIQVESRSPRKIYDGRFWGDLGFIHLCYDVVNMDALKAACETQGFPFTVDSQNSFDMGEAAGRFTYTEDPDGTLIEFVETHKVPILQKLGWYLNLKKREPGKPVPTLMLKALGLNRKRD